MIFKSDLVESINSLNEDVIELFERISSVENVLDRIKRNTKSKSCANSKLEKAIGESAPQKRRGRPAGSKNKEKQSTERD